jgi:hypothetical protein
MRRALNRGVRRYAQRFARGPGYAHWLRGLWREHVDCDKGCSRKSEMLWAARGMPWW